MTKLSLAPTSVPLIKAIILGYSGTGKSTALAPLGVPSIVPGFPGYELRVLDFDGKFEEVLREVLDSMLHPKVGAPLITQSQHDTALTTNYDVAVCRENTGIVQVKAGRDMIERIGVVGRAMAWNTALQNLKRWNTAGWSANHILVVDSFTYAVTAIVNYSQDLARKLNQPLTWNDYQAPQQFVENFLTQLADVKSHVILLGHQEPIDIYKKLDELDPDTNKPKEELMETLVVPVSVGKAGRFKIPAQFNHMLVVADAESGERRVWTKSKSGVLTKTPFFARCKEYYKLQTGLPEYFMLQRKMEEQGK